MHILHARVWMVTIMDISYYHIHIWAKYGYSKLYIHIQPIYGLLFRINVKLFRVRVHIEQYAMMPHACFKV
jgi:hypothetical protein